MGLAVWISHEKPLIIVFGCILHCVGTYTHVPSICLFVSRLLASLSALSDLAIERLLHRYDALIMKRLEALKVRTLNDHGHRRFFSCFMDHICYFYGNDLACIDVIIRCKKALIRVG